MLNPKMMPGSNVSPFPSCSAATEIDLARHGLGRDGDRVREAVAVHDAVEVARHGGAAALGREEDAGLEARDVAGGEGVARREALVRGPQVRELVLEGDVLALDAAEPVWKSTSELGCPDQTSELSSSVTSKSIRLIFGRIDCSRRVLEARQQSSRRNRR